MSAACIILQSMLEMDYLTNSLKAVVQGGFNREGVSDHLWSIQISITPYSVDIYTLTSDNVLGFTLTGALSTNRVLPNIEDLNL